MVSKRVLGQECQPPAVQVVGGFRKKIVVADDVFPGKSIHNALAGFRPADAFLLRAPLPGKPTELLFHFRHELRQRLAKCVTDRPQLNHVEPRLSPFGLADKRLTPIEQRSQFSLRNAGRASGRPQQF